LKALMLGASVSLLQIRSCLRTLRPTDPVVASVDVLD